MYAFEEAFVAEVGADASSDSDEGELSPPEASQELADFLTDLKLKGKLSAKDICLIAWYAKIAGLTGAAADFAFRPNAPSGHYNRHVKSVLKLDEYVNGVYEVAVPGHDRYSMGRVTHQLPALNPHESLAMELEANPNMALELERSCVDKEWSSAYFEHAVVRSAAPGQMVWPLALYIDGVPFIKRDSLVCFCAYNLVSGKRHLLVTLRKSEMCRCGCLGWCSYHAVWRWLAWGFQALADGSWPATRHDGDAFGLAESWRADRAASQHPPLMKGALVNLKGDWAEIVHTWGFASWRSVAHPCFCCWTTRAELYQVGDTSPVQGPKRSKTPADYEKACSDCEVTVEVPDETTKARLIGLLFFDKRKKGGQGRCMRQPWVELGLRQGDRLEPSIRTPDIGNLETKPTPCTLIFWRPANETLCKHRCPMFLVTGVTLQSLALDSLHTLNLGTYKAYCCTGIWACISCDVWEDRASTVEVRHELGTRRVREALLAWYKDQKQKHPWETLHTLNDLTPSMLGEEHTPALATKAAETGTLLEFVRDLVATHQRKLDERGPFLLAVGDALVRVRAVCKANGRVLTAAQTQELVDSAKRAFVLHPRAGIPSTPKWHLMLHLVARAYYHGNPTSYSTFLDESYNGTIADMARRCHRQTWHKSLLAAFRWASERQREVRARR